MVCHGQTVDSLTYRIQFGHNSSVVDTSRAENASALLRFAYDLDSLHRASEKVKILEITACGCASWEGSYTNNLSLCDKRAQKVINYLKSTTGVDVLRKEPYPFVVEFMEIIQECTSDYRDTVLAILGNNDVEEQKYSELRAIDGGRCWKWLNSSVFPSQRRVDIVIRYSVREAVTAAQVVSEPPVIEEVPVKTVEPVTMVEPKQTEEPVVLTAEAESANAVVTEPADAIESKSSFLLAIKNNIIYDAALVANLGVEIGFGKHFSVDIPVTYSPYTISRNYRMRTLSVQPDLRYYLKEGWRGHFFGIHGNFAYYNVVTPFNTKTRYQDRDGKHPLYGGGISYGYSLPFRKDSRWGVEFTIGVGYAYLDYDCFYNVDNGAWFTKDTKHYFGIDKAGVTIYYRIVDKNRKKK